MCHDALSSYVFHICEESIRSMNVLSIIKTKIQVYLSRLILSPSKYSPLTATHLCQRLIQFSEHLWCSSFSIAIRAVFDFCITPCRLLKRVPRSGFLTRSNRKDSQQDESGEFVGCWMVFVSFLIKNSRIMMALCDGALSWCRIHELFAQKFFFFWRIALHYDTEIA